MNSVVAAVDDDGLGIQEESHVWQQVLWTMASQRNTESVLYIFLKGCQPVPRHAIRRTIWPGVRRHAAFPSCVQVSWMGLGGRSIGPV